MATWTYHDYANQGSASARLSRARLFRAELIAATGPDYAINGRSKGNSPLIELLKQVDLDIARYSRLDASTSSGFTRARPI